MKTKFAKPKKMKRTMLTLITLTALMAAGCGDIDISSVDISRVGNPPVGGKQPPTGDFYLKTLKVYYADDEAQKNLIEPAFSNRIPGVYSVTEADKGHGTIIVEAQPESENARVKIKWTLGVSSGEMLEPGAEGEAVELKGIEIPDANASQQRNTLVEISVSNGGKFYNYTVEIKAPGTDSSLASLSVKYGNANEDDEKEAAGFFYGEGNWFVSSRYAYTVEIPFDDMDRAANSGLVIAALPNKGSEVSIDDDGGIPAKWGVALEEFTPNDEPALSVKFDEVENPGLEGEDIVEEPSEPVTKYWKLQVPSAGSEAATIRLKVSNGNIYSFYSITIVPPPDDTENTDSSLMNLQVKCAEGEGGYMISDFQATSSAYTVLVADWQKTAIIESCQPSYHRSTVAVTIGDEPPFYYPAGNEGKVINLPAKGAPDLTVRFKVTAQDQMYTREYTVTFIHPKTYSTWVGTIDLSGNGKNNYKISGLNVVTADGASHKAVMSDVNGWSIEIDDDAASEANPPRAFVAELKNGSAAYRQTLTVASPNVIKPASNITLTAKIASSGLDAPYLAIYDAKTLSETLGSGEGKTKNYYLENDIDLTSLPSPWKGPEGYSGHFNGGGNTIKLQLSQTSGFTGLFNSLANGAIVENLKVDVSTKNNQPLVMTSDSWFGGVIGSFSNDGTYKIKSVSVKGSLQYAGNYTKTVCLLVGALVGEIKEQAKIDLTVEDCEADINITGTFGTNQSVMFCFGGLIGKSGTEKGSVTIKNSRTSGNIDVTVNDAKRGLAVGGLIGAVGNSDNNQGSTTGPLVIENCYSSMEIVAKATGTISHLSAGGLIGSLYNSNSSSKIIDSAALNPRVLAIASSKANSNRVIGLKGNFNNNNLSNNYALSSMLTGTSGSGSIYSGAAGLKTPAGESKDKNFFKDANNWKTALKFDTKKWDFSNISDGNGPKLKFKLDD
ncbi:MAG: hypothetical protein LBH18_08030 [Spirochaetaceae bacterium]|jgi:hypothetical protein|nr:hypothetical protein [Spirochaetaceae bacterium]